MEILILGVVLFIIGVVATIVYDKRQDIKLVLQKKQEASQAKRATAAKSISDIHEEFLQKFKASISTPKTTTRKPISQKKKLKTTVTVEDGSINSTMSVEELIEKIEKMKKKL